MGEAIVTFGIAKESDMAEIDSIVKYAGGDMRDAHAMQFTVAYVNGHVVGCVRIRPVSESIWMLASLAVHPQFRERGIGTNLVSKCVASFQKRPIYLLCYADREHFYIKNGFTRIDPSNLPDPLRTGYFRARERSEGKNEVMAMVLT